MSIRCMFGCTTHSFDPISGQKSGTVIARVVVDNWTVNQISLIQLKENHELV